MAFGVSQLKQETPSWAKYMFRVWFILTTVAAFWIGGTNLVPDATKVEIINGLKASDLLIWSLSKMFGVEVKQEGTENEPYQGPQL